MNRLQTAALYLLLLLAAACALACGGGERSSAQDERPPLGLEEIRRNVNGHAVEVPSADGKSKPIDWFFDPSEPKEIEIVEQKVEGDTATFLVNMKTRTVPRARNPRSLSGQLRLHYRLESGLVLREWRINDIENVSFTYTNEPPPSPAAGANSNAKGGDSANDNAQNSNAKPDANAKPGASRNAPART